MEKPNLSAENFHIYDEGFTHCLNVFRQISKKVVPEQAETLNMLCDHVDDAWQAAKIPPKE